MHEEILIPLGGIVMIILIVWFATRTERAKIEARAELNKHLLEKFKSAQELTEFLEREAGQRFLDGLGSEKKHGPKERILGIIIPGCILTSIGTGFLVMGWGDPDGRLWVGGVTIFAAGMGLLIAAAVSYALSKAWGLMNGKSPTARPRE